MKVITTQKLILTPFKKEFRYRYAWNKKRGVKKDYWFTPSGECKIYIGALNLNLIGKIDKNLFIKLIKELKDNKCDAFNQYSCLYTLTNGDSISEVFNLNPILAEANVEWEERKDIESWESNK